MRLLRKYLRDDVLWRFPALRKLFITAFMAAIQILQLRQAHLGDASRKTSIVFSDGQVNCMQDLLP
jgi:hypothetical protein